MKKILLSLIIISVILSTAYALVAWLFPNTATFPRIPTGEGTIGKVIWTIVGTTDLTSVSIDGEVLNSRALSGVSSSGYLKNDINCPGTQKYIGIDADGKRLCGMSSTFLTDYGKIHSQDCPADYYRVDDTQGLTSTGDVLKAWDIVKTPPGCTMTIVFEDHSLLRLDGDTTISLDLGTFADGSTIASAILSNGSVWWRILTETWAYNVGTDVIVVWVRGTSIAITSTWNIITITNTGSGWGITRIPGPTLTQVNLVDSRISTGATAHCKNKITWLLESLTNLKIGDTYTINPLWCDLIKPNAVSIVKHQNFGNTWIRKNTRDDIKYMYDLRSLSGGLLTSTKKDLIKDEILTTIPNVTGTWILTVSWALEASNICEPWFRWWNERVWCQDSTILAIADFTRPVPEVAWLAPLIIYGNPTKIENTTWFVAFPDAGKGVEILSNQFIAYNPVTLTSQLGWSLNGRRIIVETSGQVDPNKYILFFDGAFRAQTKTFPPHLCSIDGWTCELKDISIGMTRDLWEVKINSWNFPNFRLWWAGAATTWIEKRINKIIIK